MNTTLLTEKEVAKIYGFELSTLRNHRFCGRGFPFVRIGRRVFYRSQDIERYIEEHIFKSTTHADAYAQDELARLIKEQQERNSRKNT
jgi:predicted DNA-binding transcriptional regulator AlpA